jgi:hypothetical protein
VFCKRQAHTHSAPALHVLPLYLEDERLPGRTHGCCMITKQTQQPKRRARSATAGCRQALTLGLNPGRPHVGVEEGPRRALLRVSRHKAQPPRAASQACQFGRHCGCKA